MKRPYFSMRLPVSFVIGLLAVTSETYQIRGKFAVCITGHARTLVEKAVSNNHLTQLLQPLQSFDTYAVLELEDFTQNITFLTDAVQALKIGSIAFVNNGSIQIGTHSLNRRFMLDGRFGDGPRVTSRINLLL